VAPSRKNSNSFGSKHTLRHLAAFEAVTNTCCHRGGSSLDLGLAARASDDSLGRRGSCFGHVDDTCLLAGIDGLVWSSLIVCCERALIETAADCWFGSLTFSASRTY
jgi:hypothetical protein